MSFEDKIALVTGASRGIGAAIANSLGSFGATVVGTATSSDGAKKISERFKNLNIKGEGHILNVSDSDSVENIIASIKAKYEAPSILINNAGITKDNILLRMKDEEWLDVMDTNLNAIYRLSKACLRGMTKARWGRIITIGSVVASTGNPGQTNYSATKAGVLGFTKSLARELGPRNITVNCISPGGIFANQDKEFVRKYENITPSGRMGNIKDLKSVLKFLIDENNTYINGQNIAVDGGFLAW